MDETRGRSFGRYVALRSVSGAMGGESCDKELTPYYDEDDGDQWELVHVPADFHINVCAILRGDFDAIHELCRSASVAVPEHTGGVFSLGLQNLNAIEEQDYAVAAKPYALKRVRVVEETAAASFATWTFEKIDMIHERDEELVTVERLKPT